MTNNEAVTSPSSNSETVTLGELISIGGVPVEGVATPDDLTWLEGQTDFTEVPKFTEVEATYTLEREGESLYRYLSWASKVRGSIDLTGFSEARQAGVAVLVDHGLVSQRDFHSGSRAGRSTFRLTGSGLIVLGAARHAANEVIVG